jgi:hypothetical protein
LKEREFEDGTEEDEGKEKLYYIFYSLHWDFTSDAIYSVGINVPKGVAMW